MGVQRWGVWVKREAVIVVVTRTGQRSMISTAQLLVLTHCVALAGKEERGFLGQGRTEKHPLHPVALCLVVSLP